MPWANSAVLMTPPVEMLHQLSLSYPNFLHLENMSFAIDVAA